MSIWRRLGITAAFVIGIALPAAQPHSQPITDRVLAGVNALEVAGCVAVRVNFNFPIRYVSHFPAGFGHELRIKLRPIVVRSRDQPALFQRESVRAPTNNRAAIAEIRFEGDDPSGPVLTFLFRHPVAFKVGQGADFRSLVIAIPGKEPSESCLPVFPS